MELPPYRNPTVRNLLIHMWERSKFFLKKMGGIILAGSVIVWVLSSFPQGITSSTPETAGNRYEGSDNLEDSYIERMGKFLAPVFAPIGIDWRGSVAIITGLVAKELVVSTMGVIYAAEDEDETEALKTALTRSGMTRASALSFMVFVLIYMPCIATISTIRHETNSWKWTIFSIGYSTSLAWITAFVVYHGAKTIGI